MQVESPCPSIMHPHDTISCREEPLLSLFLLNGNEAVSRKIVHMWAFLIPSWSIVLGAGIFT